MKTIILLSMLYFVFVSSAPYFEVPNFPLDYSSGLDKLTNGTIVPFEWKLPKDRPYHYFNFTTDIPQPFLPVEVDKIPHGEGVWIQRYKDFAGESKVFSLEKDTSVSVITFSTFAAVFDSVTIKLLAYGKPDLRVNFHNDPAGKRQGGDEKLALLEQAHCGDLAVDDNGFHWIAYEIKAPESYHMNLELRIPHPNSFVILDEILMHYVPIFRTTTITTEAPVDPTYENESADKRIRCKVIK